MVSICAYDSAQTLSAQPAVPKGVKTLAYTRTFQLADQNAHYPRRYSRRNSHRWRSLLEVSEGQSAHKYFKVGSASS